MELICKVLIYDEKDLRGVLMFVKIKIKNIEVIENWLWKVLYYFCI